MTPERLAELRRYDDPRHLAACLNLVETSDVIDELCSEVERLNTLIVDLKEEHRQELDWWY
jgi:hypothetical protein